MNGIIKPVEMNIEGLQICPDLHMKSGCHRWGILSELRRSCNDMIFEAVRSESVPNIMSAAAQGACEDIHSQKGTTRATKMCASVCGQIHRRNNDFTERRAYIT